MFSLLPLDSIYTEFFSTNYRTNMDSPYCRNSQKFEFSWSDKICSTRYCTYVITPINWIGWKLYNMQYLLGRKFGQDRVCPDTSRVCRQLVKLLDSRLDRRRLVRRSAGCTPRLTSMELPGRWSQARMSHRAERLVGHTRKNSTSCCTLQQPKLPIR